LGLPKGSNSYGNRVTIVPAPIFMSEYFTVNTVRKGRVTGIREFGVIRYIS